MIEEKHLQTDKYAGETQPHFFKQSKWLFIGFLVMLAGFLLGWFVLLLLDASYTYHGTVLQSPTPADDFTLTGPDGNQVSLGDFRGRAILLYFGYTFCPDVCPTTLTELARAKAELAKDGQKLQVIMVTVDPERDTPEKLNKYVTHFDPSFIGLTGNDDEIAVAATPLGIFYEKQGGSETAGYLVDHTASVIAFDPDGYLRLIYPFGTPGEDIAEDIRHLIR
jgi:protein SCO1/2